MKNIFNNYKVNLENPISSKKDDFIGFDSDIKRLKNAIKKKANIIGIISDYGLGKSSIINLLKKKMCRIKNKFIVINLWDDDLSSNNGGKILTEESKMKFHKSFLRQLSLQINKYDYDYVNKRLNSNYGTAKISFPSRIKTFVIFLFYLITLILVGYLTNKFYLFVKNPLDISLNDKVIFIKYLIDIIPKIIFVFFILFIIINREVLFSLWNSSKDRNITEEDSIELYNELIKPTLWFRFRRLIIVIEDLDRISSNGMVKNYINEIYRIYIEGNKKYRKGITFIFCVKDEYMLGDINSSIEFQKEKSIYLKVFDFSSHIYRTYVDDYSILLKQLMIKDKFLKKLSFNNGDIDLNDFLWLIEGDNLDVRIIKNRLEFFKELYLRIQDRGYNNSKENPYISIKMCSFVAYLYSEHPKKTNNLLSTYNARKNFIDEKLLEKQLTNKKLLTDGLDEVEANIVDLINDNVIDDDYKKYFYNFPKSSYIYTPSQNEIAYLLTNNISINENELNNINLMISNSNKDDFLEKQLNKIINLNKGLPELVMYNKDLFKICEEEHAKKLDDLFDNMFSLSFVNIEMVCKNINKLKSTNVDKMKIFEHLKKCYEASSDFIKNNNLPNNNRIKYRISMLDFLGEYATALEEYYEEIMITEEELEFIKDLEILIKLTPIDKLDKSLYDKFFKKYDKLSTEKNIFNTGLLLLNKSNNEDIIFKVNKIHYLTEEEKEILFKTYLNNFNHLSEYKKIKVLNHLRYYNDEIISEIVKKMNHSLENEELLVAYINAVNEINDDVFDYLNSSKRLYKLNKNLFELLERNNEKMYLAYNSIFSGNIDIRLLNKEEYLCDLFFRYDNFYELIDDVFGGVNILIKNKTYLNLSKNNGIDEKIMLFSNGEQTIELFKFVLDNKDINSNIKALYLKNIKSMKSNVTNYLYDLVKSDYFSKKQIQAIYKNKDNLDKLLPTNKKISFSLLLNQKLKKSKK